MINYLVSNLTGQPPLVLQPKTPLRTIPGDGLFHRGSVAVDDDADNGSATPPTTSDADLPAPDASVDAAAGLPAPGHFDQRRLCLSRFFEHFSSFAPISPRTGEREAHYPLERTGTSASQDVEDHARWLHRGEAWEEVEPVQLAPAPAVEDEEDDEDDEGWQEGRSAEDLAEQEEFGKMLDDMSEEEIDALMVELNEALAKAEREEEDDEGATNGEEGLDEVEVEPSLFEDEDAGASTRQGHDEL